MTSRGGNTTSVRRALALLAMLGPLYFALIVLLLSLFDGDYNPITQVASDYGVGRYALEMNFGFFVAGVGTIAFALAFAMQVKGSRAGAGTALLIIAGSVLIMDSYFTTNLEGAPPTIHGTIHGFGGFFFFISGPAGLLLVTSKLGRGRLLITLTAFLFGFALLVASSVLSWNAGGLAERIVIETILLSVVCASFGLRPGAEPKKTRGSLSARDN